MKKEAAKLEREKLMLENLKQMEEQRRREEEKKQKRKAGLVKRQQREEEEKREKERKRKLVEESRRQLRLAEEKELQHKVMLSYSRFGTDTFSVLTVDISNPLVHCHPSFLILGLFP